MGPENNYFKRYIKRKNEELIKKRTLKQRKEFLARMARSENNKESNKHEKY